MACAHNQVTPNALRGVKPGHWPIGGGLYHFDGLFEECKQDVWRHARNDEDESTKPWQLKSVPCGC